jgi:hypothetical protein
MIGDAQTVISILALTMLGTAGLLAVLPVGTCAQCSHCRLEKLSRQRARELESGHSVSVAFCAVCGRHHRSDEDHRF